MKFTFTYIHLFFILILLLLLCVQYHNYCTNNKLRHTIFELFDYFDLVNKKICHKSIMMEEKM